MKTNIGKLMKFALPLLVLALGTLVCSSAWTAANGPVAQFPGFTPFAASAEGVAVDKIGNVYFSIRDGVRGKILKFTPAGMQSLFADVGEAEADGLAVDAAGDVYMAMALGIDRGVYRVSREGESIRLPGTEQILYPDALAFDKRGNPWPARDSYRRPCPAPPRAGSSLPRLPVIVSDPQFLPGHAAHGPARNPGS